MSESHDIEQIARDAIVRWFRDNCSLIDELIEAKQALASAREEGAKSMQERAVAVLDDIAAYCSSAGAVFKILKRAASLILALPLKEGPKL